MASGVILVSLAITNFILPLCVEKKVGVDKSAENEAYLGIIWNVIAELKSRVTPENAASIISIKRNIIRLIRQGCRTNGRNERAELRAKFITLIEANNRYVLGRLKLGQ